MRRKCFSIVTNASRGVEFYVHLSVFFCCMISQNDAARINKLGIEMSVETHIFCDQKCECWLVSSIYRSLLLQNKVLVMIGRPVA